MVFAHQGGWDEILLVALPLGLFAVLLLLANRKAKAILEREREREREQRTEAGSATGEPGAAVDGPAPAHGEHGNDEGSRQGG